MNILLSISVKNVLINKRFQLISQSEIVASALDESFLSFSKRYENLCVSLIDVVSSTHITARLSLENASKYYCMFLNSMAKIAPMFGAKVVKNIGDSLLFYFPSSTKGSMDTVLECNMAMLSFHKQLNEALKIHGLPRIDYRISSDYGPTLIAKCDKTAQEDIFGNSVNMCAKINRLAQKNSLVIGGDLYSITRDLPYLFQHTDDYTSGFKHKYPVYSVKPKYGESHV